MENKHLPDGSQIIYRPYFKLKDGRVIWAKHYGKKAFRIVLKPDSSPELAEEPPTPTETH